MTTKLAPFDWTVPNVDGSDLIAEIASIVNQGLTDVKNSVYVSTNSKNNSDGYDSYPLGISLMALTTSGVSDGGWPGITGAVLTLRRGEGGDVAYQLKFDGGVGSQTNVRARVGSSNGWSSWRMFAGAGTPSAQASGQVTLTASQTNSDGLRATYVAFPSNRFVSGDGTVRVMTSLNQTTRPDVAGPPSAVDADINGFTVYVKRGDSIAQSVSWTAVQGVD